MTERFSPEYIAFILSDEAKVLQRQWEPSIGDIFIIRDGDGARFLVVDSYEPKHPHKRWAIESVYLSVYGPDDGDLLVHKERVSSATVWLPTLTDSLDMIEEAGWRISRGSQYLVQEKMWYWLRAGRIGHATIEIGPNTVESGERSWILAAAKLAVRVLEGKE